MRYSVNIKKRHFRDDTEGHVKSSNLWWVRVPQMSMVTCIAMIRFFRAATGKGSIKHAGEGRRDLRRDRLKTNIRCSRELWR